MGKGSCGCTDVVHKQMELKVAILRTHWISVLGIAASYWIGTVVTSDAVHWQELINPLKLVIAILGGLLFSFLAAVVSYPILFLELILVDLLLVGYIRNSYVVTIACIVLVSTYLYWVSTFRSIDPLFDGVVISVIVLSQLLRLIPMRRIQSKITEKQ